MSFTDARLSAFAGHVLTRIRPGLPKWALDLAREGTMVEECRRLTSMVRPEARARKRPLTGTVGVRLLQRRCCRCGKQLILFGFSPHADDVF